MGLNNWGKARLRILDGGRGSRRGQAFSWLHTKERLVPAPVILHG